MNLLTETLQQVRRAKRLSQLELSMRMGVSQRHVSFVESGRAKPSRELLVVWLEELGAPLAVRNAAMLQAGFAPAYSAAPWGDPSLAVAQEALGQLLGAHDPMPAFVLDADWNLLQMNRGAQWLAGVLMPWLVPGPINLLDLLVHPEGFAKRMLNLHEVGPALLGHLREDLLLQPSLEKRVDAFAEMLRVRFGEQRLGGAPGRAAAPMLTSRFETEFGELVFFSMFSTFGTPQDITLASLRVEHMFAADEATRAVVRERVV
jgi:transcriptional regulator with XRE-family HTH domain